MYIAVPEKRFPVECLDEIFRHLCGNDLLKCTLVCPYFNDYISSTRSCMKKIDFEIIVWHRMTDHQIVNLTKSSRNHVCLKLTGNYSESFRMFLKPVDRRWAHICSNLDFQTDFHLLEFLQIFEPSVERLDFSFGKVTADCGAAFEFADLQFTKLRSLEVISSFASFYDRAFVKCKNLESLSISTIDDIRPSVLKAIRTSMKSNKRLKKLQLKCKPIFNQDISSEICFRLKEFEVQSLDPFLLVRKNLNKFLKTQWKTLETLSIDKWMGDDVMRPVLSMPRLKTLNLGLRGVGSDRDLPRSHSITTLNLSYIWGCQIREFVFEAFPNVQTLKIAEMNRTTADIIAKSCKNLKRLSIKHFKAERIADEKFFMKLKEFTCDSVPESQKSLILFKKLNGKFI